MQENRSDVFALDRSGLGAFLYADVGAEANGSVLTILSVLARLGKDPWAEAARWAALPKAAAIESLAQSISQMPLPPAALACARDTAARLVDLLPGNTQGRRPISGSQPGAPAAKWVPMMILYFALAVGISLNVLLMMKLSAGIPAPPAQATALLAAPGAAAKPLTSDRASAQDCKRK